MRAPQSSPRWPHRLAARQPLFLNVLNGVFGAWWLFWSVDQLRGDSATWSGLVTLAIGVMFLTLAARIAWVRARVRAWDAAHPGESPLGPTPAEAAAARRSRLRGWWAIAAVAGAAVVAAALVDDASARVGLLVFAVVGAAVVLVDSRRTDRPAETLAEPTAHVDA